MEKSLQQNLAVLRWMDSSWFMLVGGGIFNNRSADHHLITIILYIKRTLMEVATQKTINLVSFASDSLCVLVP